LRGQQGKALANLKTAVRLFLEEAGKMGTLDQILEEAGYLRRHGKLEAPRSISMQRVSVSVPLADAKV
jgi:hypothetical protein